MTCGFFLRRKPYYKKGRLRFDLRVILKNYVKTSRASETKQRKGAHLSLASPRLCKRWAMRRNAQFVTEAATVVLLPAAPCPDKTFCSNRFTFDWCSRAYGTPIFVCTVQFVQCPKCAVNCSYLQTPLTHSVVFRLYCIVLYNYWMGRCDGSAPSWIYISDCTV